MTVAEQITDEQITDRLEASEKAVPPLPVPRCTFADHSYPAFTASQMYEYAQTVNAALLTELQHRREAEAGEPVAWRSTQGGISLSSEQFPGSHPLYLAASPSSPASGVRVKVKPLEWHGPDFEDEYWAASLDLKYVIHPPNERGVRWLGGVGGYFRLVDEAKAVAEKHNEARIRSALWEHP